MQSRQNKTFETPIHKPMVLFFFPFPHLCLAPYWLLKSAFANFLFRLSDAQLRDAPLGRGGVQRVTAAQEPREEQEHGRAAS